MARDLTYDEIGNDISTFPDLDLTFTPITGSRVVAEGVARRWFTQRGGCFWARDMGVSITELINGDQNRTALRRWQMVLENEALKVDGVKSIDVTITYNAKEKRVEISADLVTKAGSGRLMVDISEAAELLTESFRFQEAA